ncbi:DUF4352 domain-containing protein [Streptosporangium fragile]|uniref:DUF4352 domain-containing protein n=1 Tax=Streptosporangium fragile TaxID=46186 RepID=UPI0031E9BB46
MATIALAVVALLGVSVVATLMVLDSATSTGSSGETPEAVLVDLPAQEQTEAGARAAAQQAFDLYSAGSYGEFWDRWSAQSQSLIPRDDYISVFEQCPQAAQNLRFTIDSVTVDGTGAKVNANRLIAAFTFDFTYEGQAWRYVLPADQQQEYRTKNVDQLVQERRASGVCGGQDGGLRLTPPPTPSFVTQTPTAQAQTTTVAKVGETITVKGLQPGVEVAVTLDRFIGNATPSSQFLKPKDGNRYVAVELTVKNVGQEVYTDSPIVGGALIDSEGRQHQPTLAEVTEGTSFGGSITVNRGDIRKGLIVFEVPASATPAKLQFGVAVGWQKGEWALF